MTTKLHIPSAHPNRIGRPDLIQKLDQDLWHVQGERFLRRLTLLAAPAGYGKSTLLYEWIHHLGLPVAWITYDESDNDPGRFLQYLVAALRTIQPGLDAVDLSGLRSGQPADTNAIVTGVITALVNEIAANTPPFLLVIDDYHTLEDPGIHLAVRLLLDHLPGNMSLVIATRADPPLLLSRLRARRQMVEVRAADLRFSEAEASAFLRQVMDLDLHAAEIETLTTYTEGWIAGLQMAALALQGRADTGDFIRNFSGRERFVIDYLFEEVLSRQPDHIQTFLVQTSILEQMSSTLCDDVLAHSQSSQQILEYLDRANLFLVPLDHERCYYRYHRLFSDLLRHRLYRSYPDLVPQLHSRAAQCFETLGRPSIAFDHWIAARNYPKASDLITRHGYKLFEQGNFHQLNTWLQQIPEEITVSQPWLCIFNSWVLIFTGRFAEAETYLSAAEKVLLPITSTTHPSLLEQYGHVATVREYLASRSQDAEGIAHYAGLAQKYVAPGDLFIRSIISLFLGTGRYKANQYDLAHDAWAEAARMGKEAGNILIAVNALCSLGELTRIQGRLRDAFEIYQEAARLSLDERGRYLPVAAEVFVGRARLHYEWHDFGSAEGDFLAASKIFKLYPNFDLIVDNNVWLSRLRFAQGHVAEAQQLIRELDQSDRQAYYRTAATLLGYRIHLYRVTGDSLRLAQAVDAHDWSLEGKNLFAWADALIAYAQVLADQQELDRAFHLLEECRTRLETYGLWTYALKALVVQAGVLDRQGEHALALEQMQRALTLAEPEGFIRIFVDEGQAVKSLLAACRAVLAQEPGRANGASLRLLAYVDRVLSAFPGDSGESPAAPAAAQSPGSPALIDPLTERELEVLQLIAGGLSNKEIAEKLVVTVGTVKTHTSNIYRKLDVLGRTKAVAKARQIKII